MAFFQTVRDDFKDVYAAAGNDDAELAEARLDSVLKSVRRFRRRGGKAKREEMEAFLKDLEASHAVGTKRLEAKATIADQVSGIDPLTLIAILNLIFTVGKLLYAWWKRRNPDPA